MSVPNKPLTKQRSPWVERGMVRLTDHVLRVVLVRRVHDGTLRAIVAEEPSGWHASISHAFTKSGRGGRYPTWDELAHARYELLPEDIDVVMHLPPPGEYVALHDTTFHLHEHPERD